MKLNPKHPALSEARTIHRSMVLKPNRANILKLASSNSKLGKGSVVITKGKWRGFPMFSVTLQERATCPASCNRWAECYGNGMAYAHRFEHGPEFEAKLAEEVRIAAAAYPYGFTIRLHVLGDFYSVAYSALWRSMLEKHPNLHVFGYTAQEGDIADDIRLTRIRFKSRFWVRFSRNFQAGADIFAAQEGTVARSIVCPEQTGKAQSCLDCGLCWSIDTTIAFIDHDKLAKQRKEKKLHENSNGQALAPD